MSRPQRPKPVEPPKLMRRAERREQVLDAATRAFALGGFAATSLEDIAAEAGVTRVILYRHFASKAELYRAVLERGRERLLAEVDSSDHSGTIPALLRTAASDPDAFRLMFRFAAREPEFRDVTETMAFMSSKIAREQIASAVSNGPWLDWAAMLVPLVTIEAVMAWLDSGQPDPGEAAARIGHAVRGVIEAAGNMATG